MNAIRNTAYLKFHGVSIYWTGSLDRLDFGLEYLCFVSRLGHCFEFECVFEGLELMQEQPAG